MITSIIFSKNRPLQLDLTLSSIAKNFSITNSVIVIYKADSDYDSSYELLKKEHPKVVFVEQGTYLLDDILSLKNDFNSYVTFFTDDNIFYRKSITTAEELKLLSDVCCLSLRLGINTNKRDYGDGILREDRVPIEIGSTPDKNHLVWNRLSIPPGGYWAYPLSVDGHIFTTDRLSAILNTMRNWPEAFSCLQTPNKFEALLQRFFFEIPTTMMCEKYSCVVNSPNNRVQVEYSNANGLHFGYSPDVLNDLFLQGKRISLNKLDFKNIVCPHQEVDILKGLI